MPLLASFQRVLLLPITAASSHFLRLQSSSGACLFNTLGFLGGGTEILVHCVTKLQNTHIRLSMGSSNGAPWLDKREGASTSGNKEAHRTDFSKKKFSLRNPNHTPLNFPHP